MSLFSSMPRIVTVSDVTREVRAALEADGDLQDLWVQGEISTISRPNSGHLYFTLKDPGATLRCVMWRQNAQQFSPGLTEGMAVEVHGGISVYEAGGQYQLYADEIHPLGEGLLYQEFQRLKERLMAEGLFDPDRKRAIPEWPHAIGIVTSPTGAALQDILNTLRRRFPLAEVILAPTPVQGEDAPPRIVAALQSLGGVAGVEVILLARGGGSIEDLWAFNDERVVRAVAASEIPIIAGVGHETDFTLADFAADLRAPTPTAAAELATPDRLELAYSLAESDVRLNRAMELVLQGREASLLVLEGRLQRATPLQRILSDRQRIDELGGRASGALAARLAVLRARLGGLEQSLQSLNPQAILARGFSVVTRADGKVVRSTVDVRTGDEIRIRVSDGEFEATVD
ncbi:MAG TPA: exodeoxyribonuclease VII large subunit [Anaerolineales bacterium]|nr:exodeoxyribonuclease VII large subunit [Anaerolineales bacterium]